MAICLQKNTLFICGKVLKVSITMGVCATAIFDIRNMDKVGHGDTARVLTFPAGARFARASFGDNRAPPTPPRGPLGGAFRATLRPAPRFRLSIPAGARFACASTTKEKSALRRLFLLWWGQQGSNL